MSTQTEVVYKALADFSSLSSAIKQVRDDIAALRAEEAAFNASQGTGAGSSSSPATSYSNLDKSMKLVATDYKLLSTEAQNYTRQNSVLVASHQQLSRSFDQVGSSADNVRTIQSRVIQSYAEIVKSSQDLDSAQKEIESSARDVGSAIESVSSDLDNHAKRLDAVSASSHTLSSNSNELVPVFDLISSHIRKVSIDLDNYTIASGKAAKASLPSGSSGSRSALPPGLGSAAEDTTAGAAEDAVESVLPQGGSGGSGGPTSFFKSLSDSVDDVGPRAIKLGAIFTVVVAAIAAIGPAIAIVGALGSALGAVVGAAAELVSNVGLLPGIFASVGVAAGALLLSLDGIKKAVAAGFALQVDPTKESVDEIKQQEQNYSQLRDSIISVQDESETQARSFTTNSRSMRDAQEDLIKSEKDLQDARKQTIQQLTDLKLAAQDASVSQESAIANFAKEQENFKKSNADTSATAADRLQSLASLHAAQQGLVDAQNNSVKAQSAYTQAQQKGVEGSDNVISAVIGVRSALEKLSDSQYDTAKSSRDNSLSLQKTNESLIQTIQSVTESQREGTSAQYAYNLALSKLSPSAKVFVQAVVGTKTAFDDLQKSVQENFFSKFVNDIQSLINKILPEVRDNLGEVAGALGEVVDEFLKFVQMPESTKFFKDLSDSTAGFVSDLGPSFLKILDGIGNIILLSLPFIQKFVDLFGELATKFDDFTKSDSGKKVIADLFSEGFIRAQQFLDVLGRIADGFVHLLHVADPFIDFIIGGIVQAAKSYDDFAKKEDVLGQNSGLAKYLNSIKPLLVNIKGLFTDFFKYLGQQAADPKNIEFANQLITIIRDGIGPALAQLIKNLRDSGVAQDFLTAFGKLIQFIADASKSGIFDVFIKTLGAFFAALDAIVKAFNSLPPSVLNGIITPLGILAGIFASLAILEFAKILTFINKIIELSKVKGIAGIFALLPGKSSASVLPVGSRSGGSGRGAPATAGEASGEGLEAPVVLPGAGVGEGVSRTGSLFGKVGSGLTKGIGAAGLGLTAAQLFGLNLGNTGSGIATGAAAGGLVGGLPGAAIGGLAGGVSANFSDAKAGLTDIASFVGKKLSDLGSTIGDFFSKHLPDAVKGPFSTAIDTVKSWASSVSDTVSKFLNGDGKKIPDAVNVFAKASQDKTYSDQQSQAPSLADKATSYYTDPVSGKVSPLDDSGNTIPYVPIYDLNSPTSDTNKSPVGYVAPTAGSNVSQRLPQQSSDDIAKGLAAGLNAAVSAQNVTPQGSTLASGQSSPSIGSLFDTSGGAGLSNALLSAISALVDVLNKVGPSVDNLANDFNIFSNVIGPDLQALLIGSGGGSASSALINTSALGSLLPPAINQSSFVMPPSLSSTNSPMQPDQSASNGGFVVQSLTIINPVPEPATDSLPRTIRNLAYLNT